MSLMVGEITFTDGDSEDEVTFPCPDCGRRFSRKDILTRHQRSIHPKQSASSAWKSPFDRPGLYKF